MKIQIPTKKEILDYYPKYLEVHKNPWNRRMHVLGNASTVSFIVAVLYFSITSSLFFLPLLLLAPHIVYLFAWPGHLYFEKNKPATWKVNPLLTKSCDWVMMKDIFTGRIPW